ncbi:MAG: hypothetical protein Tsb002_20740 [Wenzhouxiangellaceae bacterium]
MACSTNIAGSDAGDDRKASSEQASFGYFCMLTKVTRPMAVSINKEDGLLQGRKITDLNRNGPTPK